MKNIDYLALDGRSLKTFLVVLEEGSVSAAANRLDVTQSAVSHTLVKLRLAFGDPLFVRSGRGIAPTERAVELQQPARELLDSLKGLTDKRVFDPQIGEIQFTIAANDHQRRLLFPSLLREQRAANVDLKLHFTASGVPSASMLNEARCQFIVTPFPPEGSDIFQQRLFTDHPVCFYDGSVRRPPRTVEEFAQRDHVVVLFNDSRLATVLHPNEQYGKLKKPFCTVSNFAAVADFIVGTDVITISASFMKLSVLEQLDVAPIPFEAGSIGMYLVWHRRDHADPAHRWMREKIKDQAQALPAVGAR